MKKKEDINHQQNINFRITGIKRLLEILFHQYQFYSSLPPPPLSKKNKIRYASIFGRVKGINCSVENRISDLQSMTLVAALYRELNRQCGDYQ